MKKRDYFLTAPAATVSTEGDMIYMRLVTNFIAGLLLTGILALAPATHSVTEEVGAAADTLGRGGGHFGGFHGGFGSRGVGAVGQGFHGPIAQGGRGSGPWHYDGGWSHHCTLGTTGITVHLITGSMTMPARTMTIASPSMCSRHRVM